MTIKQYIVGTGGAELDEQLSPHKNKKNEYIRYKNDIKYEVNVDKKTCGFIVCDILDKGPTFTPILFK
jgi:hypothetical protein